MNQGELTITFYDPPTDSEVVMTTSRMSPREALEARQLWIERFAALHMATPVFGYSGPDYEGIWDDS